MRALLRGAVGLCIGLAIGTLIGKGIKRVFTSHKPRDYRAEPYGGCDGPPKMVNGAIDCIGAGQEIRVQINTETGEISIAEPGPEMTSL